MLAAVNCFVSEPIAESGIHSVRNRPVQIGISAAVANHDPITLGYEYSSHEAPVINVILDYLEHALFVQPYALCEQTRDEPENKRN